MNQVVVDGRFLPAGQPVLMIDNKSYRYGDGVFETLKVYRGRILLEHRHFDRLFNGLRTLGCAIPTPMDPTRLAQQVIQLCERNRCTDLARVRLTTFRGHGGIYDGDTSTHYTIETWPLNTAVNRLNENGLEIGIYPYARKSSDVFSRLKSANYLPYVMAAQYAKEKKWNDCLVLNTHERIADASIANLFIVKNNEIITPPLSEGCVEGVMRAHLLAHFPVTEMPVDKNMLGEADEIFLSNAINGIRWVKGYDNRSYRNRKAVEIFSTLSKTFYG